MSDSDFCSKNDNTLSPPLPPKTSKWGFFFPGERLDNTSINRIYNPMQGKAIILEDFLKEAKPMIGYSFDGGQFFNSLIPHLRATLVFVQ